MAKQEKITVELSNTDRQLLRDIRDALRSDDVALTPEESEQLKRRLVELHDERAQGGYVEPDFGDHMLMESHFDAETKGYTWNGSGWVPKE